MQATIIVVVSIAVLIGSTALMEYLHKPYKKACIDAGHTWHAAEYICDANLKK